MATSEVPSSYWIFQAQPRRYDVAEALQEGTVATWVVTRYSARMRAGDVVYLWRAGERALYGWGTLTGEVTSRRKKGGDGRRQILRSVAVEYRVRFSRPVPFEEIRDAGHELAQLLIVRVPQGTNFPVSTAQARELHRLLEDRGELAPPPPQEEPPIQVLDFEGLFELPLAEESRHILRRASRLAMPSGLSGLVTLDALFWATAEFGESMAKSFPSDSACDWLFHYCARPFSDDFPEGAGLLRYQDEPFNSEEPLEFHPPGERGATPTLGETLELAHELASSTSTDGIVHGRHLVAATLFAGPRVQGSRVPVLLADAGISLETLRQEFLAWLVKHHGDDTMAPWLDLLEPKGRLTLHDYAADDLEGRDALDITPDVAAFATVVASRVLRPPLAIGLFGDWGSGKSFFMRQLMGEVERLSQLAKRPGDSPPGAWVEDPGSPYLPKIVQIEFNAWNYVESNLWASLVSHIFDNLRMSQHEPRADVDQRRDEILGELEAAAEVKARAEAERRAATKHHQEIERRLLALRRQRDEAQQRLSLERVLAYVRAADLSQLLSPTVDKIWRQLQERAASPPATATETETETETETGDEEVPPGGKLEGVEQARQLLAELHNCTHEGRSLLGRLSRILTGMKTTQGRRQVVIAVLLTAGLALMGWCGGWLMDQIAQVKMSAELVGIGSMTGLLTGLGRLLTGLRQGLDKTEGLRQRLEEELGHLAHSQSPQALELERQAQVAEQRLATAELEIEAATRRVEKAQAEAAAAGSGAYLARFIEERASSSDYHQHLGLLALIRRDFHHLSQRMEAMRHQGDVSLHDPGRIDRIVLYIDDLDRCPPRRVVQVLQAIHLLLAYPLFVVVVGVDARWLARCVQRGALDLDFASGLARDPAAASPSSLPDSAANDVHPVDYLEKIFQVPFWLRPMSPRSFSALVDSLLEKDLELSEAASPADGDEESSPPGAAPSPPTRGPQSPPAPAPESPPAGVVPSGTPPYSDPAVGRLVESSPETLVVTHEEVEFMRRLAAVVGRSPRTTKRFVNVYRILKARARGSDDTAHLTGDRELLAGMLLVALCVGAPAGAGEIVSEISAASENSRALELSWPPEVRPLVEENFPTHDLTLFKHWLPLARRFSFDAAVAVER